MNEIEFKYQIYGSKSSNDLDIMVFVDKLGNIEENKNNIQLFKNIFSKIYTNINCDVHLATLHNGQVIDVSHGTYDEVNNSLYYTYNNFEQKFDNLINKPYDRLNTDEFINKKIIRVARFILSFFSREPELRSDIKKALRGDLIEKIKVLNNIDFTKYTEFPKKKEKKEDIYKVCAFQFAQVFGLIAKNEIYTKEDVINHFDNLKPFILREKNINDQLYILNNCIELFITIINIRLKQNKFNKLTE